MSRNNIREGIGMALLAGGIVGGIGASVVSYEHFESPQYVSVEQERSIAAKDFELIGALGIVAASGLLLGVSGRREEETPVILPIPPTPSA